MSRPIARFEVVAGKALGMSILVDDELLIGRHADGAGRLADDEEISRSHARLSLDRSGFCAIEDLGSTNGTYVNGLRIKGPQTLSEGDTVEVGGTTLVVRDLPSRSASSVTPRPGTRTTGRLSDFDSQLTPTTVGPRPSTAVRGGDSEDTGETRSCRSSSTWTSRLGRRASPSSTARIPLRFVYKDGSWRPV